MGQKKRVPAVVHVALLSQPSEATGRAELDAVIEHVERRIAQLNDPGVDIDREVRVRGSCR